MSASVVKDIVEKRGHIVKEYPLVLEDAVENLSKTKDVLDLLEKIGLKEELQRASRKKQKTGNAKRRGRPYKKAVGPLFVVSKECNLLKSASNIPGVDAVIVEKLNTGLLAPGTQCGRLTIYTKGSIDKIEKMRLFTDNPIFKKEEKPKEDKVTKEKTDKKAVKKTAVKKPKSDAKKTVKKTKAKTTKKEEKK